MTELNQYPDAIKSEEVPEDVKFLQEINGGKINIDTYDWYGYLSTILNIHSHFDKQFSYVSFFWCLLCEIDDPIKRIKIIGIWKDLARQCFSDTEKADDFITEMSYLITLYKRVHKLIIDSPDSAPHTYDSVLYGKGLKELAWIWSNKHISGKDMVALASEIRQTLQERTKEPVIDYFLYCNRQYDKLVFENIADFSCNLFIAESFRQYLVEGKMYTTAPLAFGDFNRKLRNACFDEYIRLRIEQIREEKENDNWQLLDPTEEDCYQQLYEDEKSIYDREIMFEDFRGSEAYSQQWYKGRPEVLNMIQYFMKYLDWKMQHLHDEPHLSHQPQVVVNNGDYVAGNKYSGTIVEKVENGGVGVQHVHNGEKVGDELETGVNIPPIPPKNNYNEVRRYIEERKKNDQHFKYYCETHNRKELCEYLSKEFGWIVDDHSLGANINRH